MGPVRTRYQRPETGDDEAFAATAPRGTGAWLAGVSPDMRVEVDPTFLLKGRKLRGLIEGNSHDAAAFINRLIDLYRAKRFPFDRLITFYAADQLNLAIADALAGNVIKPVLRFSH